MHVASVIGDSQVRYWGRSLADRLRAPQHWVRQIHHVGNNGAIFEPSSERM